ncbi:membrane protein insertase YidC [Hydrogenophilus islandicus]
MMEQRRLILLVVFLFSLFMLWEGWVRQNGPTPERPVAATDPAPSRSPSTIGDVPVAAAKGAVGDERAQESDALAAKRLHLETDRYLIEISEQGGDILFLALKDHRDRERPDQPFVLFDDGRLKHTYRVQSGVVGQGMPNHRSRWQLPAESLVLPEGRDSLVVTLTATTEDGRTVRKILRFTRGSYLIDVRHEIDGGGSLTTYYHFLRDGLPAEEQSLFGVRTFTGPAIYTEATKYRKIDFQAIADGKADYPREAQDGWLAMIQHYFVAAWLPPQGVAREYYLRRLANGLYQAGVLLTGDGATETRLYAGPQDQKVLGSVAPGFDLVVDYGWLTFIAAPLFWLLSLLHALTGNWGWAIILVTVLIKALFYPLSAASYRSMARMRLVMPRLQKIKEAYGDDKVRLQQEMMRLYQEERINPLGGCLPILVQIPVFIALYWVLLASVEMRYAPWLGWITDLSSRDPYFILPLLMGATMIIQMRLNPQPTDPLQAKLMMAMPIVFTFMFLWFPSGLVLYWLVNNILSIAQQWWINRQLERMGLGHKAVKAAND